MPAGRLTRVKKSPGRGKGVDRSISRVLSWATIHLGPASPRALKRPTRIQRGPRHGIPIWSCSGWGLPCHRCYQRRGALLPHLFTLTRSRTNGRFVFCGTVRDRAVASAAPRRYLAPCPMEPGLSSSDVSRQRLPDRSGADNSRQNRAMLHA